MDMEAEFHAFQIEWKKFQVNVTSLISDVGTLAEQNTIIQKDMETMEKNILSAIAKS